MSVLSEVLHILNRTIDFSKYRNKTFLITGSTGFLGSVITRLCIDNDISVVLPVRDKQKAINLFGVSPKYIECCIENLPHIEGDVNYIIHTASPTKSSFYINNPVETIQTLVLGTNKVLELSKEKSVESLVYLSSMEVYGVVKEEMNPVSEDKLGYISIENVRSSYSEGKRLCELLVKSFNNEYGVPAKIVRLANCFGPGVPPTDERMFMQFARAVINRKPIVLHTEGISNSNFIYITDAIRAIFTVLERGSQGESYNVCNDQETRQVRDIASMITSEIADNKINVIYDIPEGNKFGYAANTFLRLDSHKLNNLGWEAQVSMCDAYNKLIEYLTEEELYSVKKSDQGLLLDKTQELLEEDE